MWHKMVVAPSNQVLHQQIRRGRVCDAGVQNCGKHAEIILVGRPAKMLRFTMKPYQTKSCSDRLIFCMNPDNTKPSKSKTKPKSFPS